MSKYARKQKPVRGGKFKICQTLFKPQAQAVAEIKTYWDIISTLKDKPSLGKEMMRISMECVWEGREYAEAYNKRKIAKDGAK